MGKKSREKRLRREQRERGQQSSGLQLTQFEHPLAQIPRAKVAEMFQVAGREQAVRFVQTTAKIEAVIAKVNPLCLLSALTAYGLVSAVKTDGTIDSIIPLKIFPAHVELAHALCLRLPNGEAGAPALGHDTQEAFDTLIEWTEQFHAKRLVQFDDSLPDLERKRLVVQERIRTATQMLRNWAFPGQVKKVAHDIVSPLDGRFEAKFGFRATQCIAIFEWMFVELGRRIESHWEKVRLTLTSKSIGEAVQQHYKNFPGLEGSPEDVVALFRERRASLKDAKYMMLSHSDMRLVDVCRFAAKEIGAALGMPDDVVSKVLSAFSLRFGDLSGHEIEHFFLNNPVWTKPVIELKADEFFCCMPQSFFAFALDIFLSLVRSDESLRDAFDKRRSDYLEESVERLFRDAFPSGKVTANFKWKSADKTQEFESDLIVAVDSYLFLVEAKSGRVSPQARRGAAQSLGDDIDGLLVEPSRQSQRLADAILAAKSKGPGAADFLAGFPADLNMIQRVVRLSVTLDDIGFLQTNVSELKEAGYVPQELVVAPAVTLTDLEVVFDLLDSEPQRVHYWVRRTEWEASAQYLADELDLLGTYLKSGLNLGDFASGEYLAMLVGESTPIDNYYEALRNGVTFERPRLQLTKWWRDMLERVEKLKPPRWLEASVTLLCAGISQQAKIESSVRRMVADVKRRREKASNKNALLFFPGRGRRNGISIVALMASELDSRHVFLENAAALAFEKHQEILECVSLAMSVDKPVYPYGTLGCFRRPDAAT
jgi:hypothetical protein